MPEREDVTRAVGGQSEAELIEAARYCDDCLGWLQHCGAACCRAFTFHLTLSSDVSFTDDEARVHTVVDDEARRYYELHGAQVAGDWVAVPRAACTVTLDRLEVHMRCTALGDDNRCAVHRRGKPRWCREFSLETASKKEFVTMPTCLYTYKSRAMAATPLDEVSAAGEPYGGESSSEGPFAGAGPASPPDAGS